MEGKALGGGKEGLGWEKKWGGRRAALAARRCALKALKVMRDNAEQEPSEVNKGGRKRHAAQERP